MDLVALKTLTTPQLRVLASGEGADPIPSSREELIDFLTQRGFVVSRANMPQARRVPHSKGSGELEAVPAHEQDPTALCAPPAAVWGAYKPHAHLSSQNVINALLFGTAILPSAVCVHWLFRSHCEQCLVGPPVTPSPLASRPVEALLGWLSLREKAGSTPAAPVCLEWPLAKHLGGAASFLERSLTPVARPLPTAAVTTPSSLLSFVFSSHMWHAC